MRRFCGWLFRTKYYIKKGYEIVGTVLFEKLTSKRQNR